MDEKIQKFINTICCHIKWKSYHSAIKSEIQNHIYDSINDLEKQGIPSEKALDLTLENMGNPDFLGKQLNEVYKPQYNKMRILSFILSIILFSVLEYFAIVKITGEYLYILKIIFRILIGSSIAFLLFISNWSNNNKVNKFAARIYLCISLLCIILNFTHFTDKMAIMYGLLLTFPPLSCCFIHKVKDKKIIGLFFIMFVFLIPLLIASYIQSFAGMIILSISSWIILLLTIKSNWLNLSKKVVLYLIVSLPYAFVLIYSFISKINNIVTNIKAFFVSETIKKSIIYGTGSIEFINNPRILDYPITLMIANYGYIILLAYIIFLVLILFEIKKVYQKQMGVLPKLLIASVFLSFITEFVFSLLLNLGVPLAKGIPAPFLDLNFGIIIKLIQLGLVETLDCFGNYIYSNYSNSKLFDIEGGKIIIYYK